jgi:rhodanese-related sulfurtransferase
VFGQSVPSITAADVESRRSEGWMILDVREDHEWASGRIPGSTHIPMHEVVARLDEVDDRVVCVCAVGGRSARVTAYLSSQGRDAVNLDGGIYAWAGEGHPIES